MICVVDDDWLSAQILYNPSHMPWKLLNTVISTSVFTTVQNQLGPPHPLWMVSWCALFIVTTVSVRISIFNVYIQIYCRSFSENYFFQIPFAVYYNWPVILFYVMVLLTNLYSLCLQLWIIFHNFWLTFELFMIARHKYNSIAPHWINYLR